MLINKIKFVAQDAAPNPNEVDYWINTSVDPNGGEIQHYDGTQFKTISGAIKWSVLLQQYNLVTMTIDDANSNPVIPVTGDTSWIKGKRCLAKPMSDGSVSIAFLHEDDSTKYYDGSDAALDGSEGEFMVYFPETWVKCTEVDGVTTVEVSDGDNGGAYFRSVLLGAVHTVGSSTSRSVINGAKPQVSVTIAKAHENVFNTFGEGWSIMDYEARNKVTLMAYAKYGTRDLQSVIGYGDSSFIFIEGATVSLGNKDGELTNTSGKICNSMLGIENYFNNVADWLGGIHQVLTPDSDLFYIYDGVQVYAENGIPSTPYRTINPSSAGKMEAGTITKMLLGEHADLFPVKTAGDQNLSQISTYYADSGVFYTADNGSVVSSNYQVVVVYVGGPGAFPAGGGGFFGADGDPSNSGSIMGSRLQFRGKINEISNINQFKALPSLGAA